MNAEFCSIEASKPSHLFKSGNQLYKMRTKDGKDKLFATPEIFVNEAIKYFNWCESNKWIVQDFIKSGQDAGKIVNLERDRPMSIEGLCNFLGITYQTFSNYEKDERYKDYFDVLSYVRKVVEVNQFEGGSVGVFNSAIMIRKLGLKDSLEHSGEVNNTITSITFTQRTIEDTEFNEVQRMLDQE